VSAAPGGVAFGLDRRALVKLAKELSVLEALRHPPLKRGHDHEPTT
jgi:hypothetical protein